jgi:Zn-dependent oligopeptidase
MSKDWLDSRLIVDKAKDNRKVYKISLNYPDYVPIMEKCSNRNTRRILLTAYISRCMGVNCKIASDILKLKHYPIKIA